MGRGRVCRGRPTRNGRVLTWKRRVLTCGGRVCAQSPPGGGVPTVGGDLRRPRLRRPRGHARAAAGQVRGRRRRCQARRRRACAHSPYPSSLHPRTIAAGVATPYPVSHPALGRWVLDACYTTVTRLLHDGLHDCSAGGASCAPSTWRRCASSSASLRPGRPEPRRVSRAPPGARRALAVRAASASCTK